MAVSTPSPPPPVAPVTAVDPPPRRTRAPVAAVLLAGLLLAAVYAAFAGGATSRPELARLQLGLVVLGVVAVSAWLGARRVRPAAHPLTVAGLAVLAGLAVWTGASLAWSVVPDRSWAELNRVLAYLLAAGVAVVVGSALPRANARAATGWVWAALVIALYALAGKVFPGVVDHALVVARLRVPLEYWNALGIVCAMGAIVAARLAAQPDGRARGRIGALVALGLLLCALGMTLSRGAILALLAGMAVLVALRGPRLRTLAAFALGVLGAAPVLALVFSVPELSDNGVARDERIEAGLLLGVVLLAMVVLLAAAGRFLLGREARRAGRPPVRTRPVWLVLAAVAAALVVAGFAALAAGEGGVSGSSGRIADEFTAIAPGERYQPERLLDATSSGRWAWWREATGAFLDEPVLGWGASAFPVSRRLYRLAPGPAEHPHSQPLAWLSDLGVIGAVLGIGALALLVAGAALRLGATAPGRERDLGAALLAAAAALLVHALADRTWGVPGAALPALIALGVLGGCPPRPRPALLEQAAARRTLGRSLALAAAVLALCAVLASAVLPAWSDARTDSALRLAGDPVTLEDAAKDAAFASRLNPTAVRPKLAESDVAERRGRVLEARRFVLEALDRQPSSVVAWARLTQIALRLADREGARQAVLRALALDPADDRLEQTARTLQAVTAPPEASATATGTPLPPPPVQEGGLTGGLPPVAPPTITP